VSSDCAIVGASFAGLACATVLARRGLDVVVLERKHDAGDKLHTTGILVRDVIDQVSLFDTLPQALARRVEGVRLYAPNLTSVDLDAPGYYFLATDTHGVLRWMAEQAAASGARVCWDTAFTSAARTRSGFDLGEDLGGTRYLVGADGPASSVAKSLGLGRNRHFLAGIEHEYPGFAIDDPDRLHCFIDRRLMPGYIGWVVQGVGVTQVGLARRLRGDAAELKRAMQAFLVKIAPLFDFRAATAATVRAGLIPCGGVVRPASAARVVLVGDAAGLVSPVTAGGIHTALKHGLAAGHAIGDFLQGRGADPAGALVADYPAFRVKRLLRFVFDHLQSDLACNLLLQTRAMRQAAALVYFHRRSVATPESAR